MSKFAQERSLAQPSETQTKHLHGGLGLQEEKRQIERYRVSYGDLIENREKDCLHLSSARKERT
jgi:hypothetical protein